MIKADEVGFFEIVKSTTSKNAYVIIDRVSSEFGLGGVGETAYIYTEKSDVNWTTWNKKARQFRSVRNAIRLVLKIEKSWKA